MDKQNDMAIKHLTPKAPEEILKEPRKAIKDKSWWRKTGKEEIFFDITTKLISYMFSPIEYANGEISSIYTNFINVPYEVLEKENLISFITDPEPEFIKEFKGKEIDVLTLEITDQGNYYFIIEQ